MSKFLQDALRASMEAEVMQDGPIDADAKLISDVDQTLEASASVATDAGPTASDLKDQVDSTDNVASVLETIGDAALSTPETTVQPLADGQIENPAPNGEVVVSTGVAVPASMESLAFTLQAVLASHGVALAGPAMESGEAQGQAIARVAHTTAGNLRSNLEVSLEDSTKDSIKVLTSKAENIAEAKRVLATAARSVAGKKAQLDEHLVCVNQAGVYNFMHRDGEFVQDLGGAFAPDLKVLQSLKAVITKGAGAYDHLVGNESNVEKFIQGVIDTDLSGEMKQFDGVSLLGDKHVTLNDGVLHVSAGDLKSDGSKVGAGKTAKVVAYGYIVSGTVGALKGLTLGAVVGGVVGGAIAAAGTAGVGTAVGATVGANVGVSLGSNIGGYTAMFKSIRGGMAKARLDAAGRNTNVPVELSEVMKFLDTAETMCGMVDGLPALLESVNAADKAAREYARTIGADAPAGLIDKMVTAVGARNKDGRKQTSGTAGGTQVLNALNVNYLIYLSASQLMIDHLHQCVSTALQIAQTIIKE